MNNLNAKALAGLSDLTRLAREIDWHGVDAGNSVFLARLGQADALASQGSAPPNAADRDQSELIAERRRLLEQMVAAGPSWAYTAGVVH